MTAARKHPKDNNDEEFWNKFLKYGKPAVDGDIPAKKNSIVGRLPFWPEVEELLNHVKEDKAVPFRGLGYNVKDYPDMKQLHEPVQSLIQSMRTRVKKSGQQGKVEVVNRGDVVWIVVVP